MKVNILASGSQGNCIALTSGETSILIDCGIAKTKIEKALLNVGITPDQIAAIFITHAHKDHIKGVPLANKYKIPVFASEGEWESIKGVDDDLKCLMEQKVTVELNDTPFFINSFEVHHDAVEPLGFTIEDDDGCKVSVCLDTGKVTDEILAAMKGSDIYIIEANHEPNMVEASEYPNSVKARILSHVGHLSNEQTAEALTKLIQGRGEQIFLTHLSHSNNLPGLAEMTVMRALKQKGFIKGKHYGIEVI